MATIPSPSADKPPPASRTAHYLALDLARGLAALAVMIYHAAELFDRRDLFPGAYLAVDLFFLMSGFVVANSYETKLRNGSLSFGRFAVVRIIRLYPLYIISVAIGAAYYLGKVALHQPTAVPAATLLASAPPALLVLPSTVKGFEGFAFSPASWSLSLEIWFNLVYALTAVRLGWRALCAVALISLAVLVQQALAHNSVDLVFSDLPALLGSSARFWFSFTVGILAWRLMRSPAWRLPPRLDALLQAGWPLVFLAGFLFILIPTGAVWTELAFVAFGFPLFVYIAAHIRAGPVMSKISDHAGRLSYGVYILHGPVMLLTLGLATSKFGRIWREDAGLASAVLIGGVLLATAILTYLVDEPVRRRLRTQTQGRRRDAASATAG